MNPKIRGEALGTDDDDSKVADVLGLLRYRSCDIDGKPGPCRRTEQISKLVGRRARRHLPAWKGITTVTASSIPRRSNQIPIGGGSDIKHMPKQERE